MSELSHAPLATDSARSADSPSQSDIHQLSVARVESGGSQEPSSSQAGAIHWVFCLGPLWSTSLAGALFIAFQVWFPLTSGRMPVVKQPMQEALQAVMPAYVNWVASFFVAALVLALLVVRCGLTLWRCAPSPSFIGWTGAGALLAFVVARTPKLAPPLVASEAAQIDRLFGFSTWATLSWYFPLVIGTGAILTGTIVSLLWGLRSQRPRLADVIRAQAVVRGLLVLTSTWFVCGVLGGGLYHRILLGALGPEAAQSWAALAASVTVLTGVFYSSLAAATFLPAETFLRDAAERAAQSEGQGPPDLKKFLEEHGFNLSVSGEVVRIAALLSPLLTSVLQGLVHLG